jgi:AcrR family transcriptional regulator
MLYYHFDNKAALYRAILREVFETVATAVSAVRDTAGTPADRLRAYIRIVARQLVARPHFPPLWLREVAEGGRHLDAGTVGQMRRVVDTLAGLLQEGRRAGVFTDVNPFIAQVGIIAPLLMIAASAPVRERFRRQIPGPVAAASYADAIAHVEAATLAAVLAPGLRPPAPVPAHSGSTSS